MRRLLFFILFVFLFCYGYGQSATASASKGGILIGEPFTLKLQGFFQNGQTINWVALDSLPHFEILERSKIDTEKNDQNILLTQSFTITSWDSGRWQIPAIALGRSKTAPVIITVSFSSPFDASQPYHDIKDILEAKQNEDSKWYWYVVGIIVLIALFLLFFPGKKDKEQKEFVSDEGAYRNALKKLQKLDAAAEPKILYTAMIDIFREYLHRRKNIQSFSKTTDDLSIQMEKLHIAPEKYRALVQTLRLSDMVKYAQYTPTVAESETALETIRQGIISIEGL